MTTTETREFQNLQRRLRDTRDELLREDTTDERKRQLRARRERLLNLRDELEGL